MNTSIMLTPDTAKDDGCAGDVGGSYPLADHVNRLTPVVRGLPIAHVPNNNWVAIKFVNTAVDE